VIKKKKDAFDQRKKASAMKDATKNNGELNLGP